MVQFWLNKSNRCWLKSTALTTLFALLFSIAVPPFADASFWADRKKAADNMSDKKQGVESAFQETQAGTAESRPAIDLNRAEPAQVSVEKSGTGLEIPEELGTVVEIWNGGGSLSGYPMIVHIQDAHGFYEAQKNASAILKYLHSPNAKQPLLVCVEGAWDRLDGAWLNVFPDEKLKNKMVENLFKNGELTGEEYWSLTEKDDTRKPEIIGIEDKDVFTANLKSRELINRGRPALLERLDVLESRLKKIKNGVYVKKLQELDLAAQQYQSGKGSLKDYFKYLRWASSESWDAARYPNLAAMVELMNLEEMITPQSLDGERARVLNELGSKLDQTSLARLVQVSLNYRLGKVSSLRYHEGLLRLAGLHNLAAPAVEMYVNYLRRSQSINNAEVSAELTRLEEESFLALVKGDPDVDVLVRMSWALRTQKKFWDEKFSPQDWQAYKDAFFSGGKPAESLAPYGLPEIEAYIEGQEKKFGLKAEPLESLRDAEFSGAESVPGDVFAAGGDAASAGSLSFAKLRFLQESYYKLAFSRDEIMLANALEKAQVSGRDKVVLITGGFHTPGMTARLRKKGVAYAVIRPKFKAAHAETSSPESFDGRLAPLPREDFGKAAAEYARNLETLERTENETGSQPKKDADSHKGLVNVIDMVKNRISLEGPMERDGKVYLMGAYRGDQSQVNFLMGFSKNSGSDKLVSSELQDALKASMGTLREMMRSFLGGEMSTTTLLTLLGYKKLGTADMPLTELRAGNVLEMKRFLLAGPMALPEGSDLTLERAREIWGANYLVVPDRIEERDGVQYLHFRQNDALLKQVVKAKTEMLKKRLQASVQQNIVEPANVQRSLWALQTASFRARFGETLQALEDLSAWIASLAAGMTGANREMTAETVSVKDDIRGGALKNLVDSDLKVSDEDKRVLEEYAGRSRNKETRPVDPPARFGGKDAYSVTFVKVRDGDQADGIFKKYNIAGAYNIAVPDPAGDRLFVFVRENDAHYTFKENHEIAELYWEIFRVPGNELPEGFDVQRAAHVLAWGQQILDEEWTSADQAAFILEQLNGMSVQELRRIADEKRRERSAHKKIRKDFGFTENQQKAIARFEDSVRAKAEAILKQKVEAPREAPKKSPVFRIVGIVLLVAIILNAVSYIYKHYVQPSGTGLSVPPSDQDASPVASPAVGQGLEATEQAQGQEQTYTAPVAQALSFPMSAEQAAAAILVRMNLARHVLEDAFLNGPTVISANQLWYSLSQPNGHWNWGKDGSLAVTDKGGAVSAADTPAVGLYDTSDPAVLLKLINLYAAQGINGMAVDYYGGREWHDANIEALLQAADQYNAAHPGRRPFTISVQYEIKVANGDYNKLKDDLRNICKLYAAHPSYQKVGGVLPMIYTFGMGDPGLGFGPDDYGRALNELTQEGYVFAFAGDAAYNPSFFTEGQANVLFNWINMEKYGDPNSDASKNPAGVEQNTYAASMQTAEQNPNGFMVMLPFYAGFNDSALGGGNWGAGTPRVLSDQDGKVQEDMSSMIAAARRQNPLASPWVMMLGDDWNEGSQMTIPDMTRGFQRIWGNMIMNARLKGVQGNPEEVINAAEDLAAVVFGGKDKIPADRKALFDLARQQIPDVNARIEQALADYSPITAEDMAKLPPPVENSALPAPSQDPTQTPGSATAAPSGPARPILTAWTARGNNASKVSVPATNEVVNNESVNVTVTGKDGSAESWGFAETGFTPVEAGSKYLLSFDAKNKNGSGYFVQIRVVEEGPNASTRFKDYFYITKVNPNGGAEMANLSDTASAQSSQNIDVLEFIRQLNPDVKVEKFQIIVGLVNLNGQNLSSANEVSVNVKLQQQSQTAAAPVALNWSPTDEAASRNNPDGTLTVYGKNKRGYGFVATSKMSFNPTLERGQLSIQPSNLSPGTKFFVQVRIGDGNEENKDFFYLTPRDTKDLAAINVEDLLQFLRDRGYQGPVSQVQILVGVVADSGNATDKHNVTMKVDFIKVPLTEPVSSLISPAGIHMFNAGSLGLPGTLRSVFFSMGMLLTSSLGALETKKRGFLGSILGLLKWLMGPLYSFLASVRRQETAGLGVMTARFLGHRGAELSKGLSAYMTAGAGGTVHFMTVDRGALDEVPDAADLEKIARYMQALRASGAVTLVLSLENPEIRRIIGGWYRTDVLDAVEAEAKRQGIRLQVVRPAPAMRILGRYRAFFEGMRRQPGEITLSGMIMVNRRQSFRVRSVSEGRGLPDKAQLPAALTLTLDGQPVLLALRRDATGTYWYDVAGFKVKFTAALRRETRIPTAAEYSLPGTVRIKESMKGSDVERALIGRRGGDRRVVVLDRPNRRLESLINDISARNNLKVLISYPQGARPEVTWPASVYNLVTSASARLASYVRGLFSRTGGQGDGAAGENLGTRQTVPVPAFASVRQFNLEVQKQIVAEGGRAVMSTVVPLMLVTVLIMAFLPMGDAHPAAIYSGIFTTLFSVVALVVLGPRGVFLARSAWGSLALNYSKKLEDLKKQKKIRLVPNEALMYRVKSLYPASDVKFVNIRDKSTFARTEFTGKGGEKKTVTFATWLVTDVDLSDVKGGYFSLPGALQIINLILRLLILPHVLSQELMRVEGQTDAYIKDHPFHTALRDAKTFFQYIKSANTIRENLSILQQNLSLLEWVVAQSLGPVQVLLIVNGGDGPIVQVKVQKVVKQIFRKDGKTVVYAHEELKPDGKPGLRGQLFGFLDAIKAFPKVTGQELDRSHVALLGMMPGSGTRMGILTESWFGIKPLLAMLIRTDKDGEFLSGAEASMFTWTLVTYILEKLGFRGVSLKWGDEPQVAAILMKSFLLLKSKITGKTEDWSEVDAVLFGSTRVMDDDKARNKEWIYVDEEASKKASYTVTKRTRRNEKSVLVKLLGLGGKDPRATTHLGSPSLSYVLIDALMEVFGEDFNQQADNMDFDGWFFEALTLTDEEWNLQIVNDKKLREMMYGIGKTLSLSQKMELDQALGVSLDSLYRMDDQIKKTVNGLMEDAEADSGKRAKAEETIARLKAMGIEGPDFGKDRHLTDEQLIELEKILNISIPGVYRLNKDFGKFVELKLEEIRNKNQPTGPLLSKLRKMGLDGPGYGAGRSFTARQIEQLSNILNDNIESQVSYTLTNQIKDWYLDPVNRESAEFEYRLKRMRNIGKSIALYPNYRDLALEVRKKVNLKRGRPEGAPLHIKMIDFEEKPFWGDIGQLPIARTNWFQLNDRKNLDPDKVVQTYFSKQLAKIDDVKPDKFGNIVVGDCQYPQDGSVKNCVLINTKIYGDANADGAVFVDSDLGNVEAAYGSVVFGCTVVNLVVAPNSLAFISVGENVTVPSRMPFKEIEERLKSSLRKQIVKDALPEDTMVSVEGLHTTMPDDPSLMARRDTNGQPVMKLEDWQTVYRVRLPIKNDKGKAEWTWVDVDISDKEDAHNYDKARFGNPKSVKEKNAVMRNRRNSLTGQKIVPDDVRNYIKLYFRRPLIDKMKALKSGQQMRPPLSDNLTRTPLDEDLKPSTAGWRGNIREQFPRDLKGRLSWLGRLLTGRSVIKVTDFIVYSLTQAFLKYLEGKVPSVPRSICLGGDLQTGRFAQAVIQACRDQGFDVVNFGKVPEPALLHSAMKQGYASIAVSVEKGLVGKFAVKFFMPEGEILDADKLGITREHKWVRQKLLLEPFDQSPFDAAGRLKKPADIPEIRRIRLQNGAFVNACEYEYMQRYLAPFGVDLRRAEKFAPGDLDIPALIAALSERISGQNTLVYGQLERFGIRRDNIEKLTEAQAVDAFNALLDMPDLYARVDVQASQLDAETQKLLGKAQDLGKAYAGKVQLKGLEGEAERKTDVLKGEELAVLNRALLKALYPQSVKSWNVLSGKNIVYYKNGDMDVIPQVLRELGANVIEVGRTQGLRNLDMENMTPGILLKLQAHSSWMEIRLMLRRLFRGDPSLKSDVDFVMFTDSDGNKPGFCAVENNPKALPQRVVSGIAKFFRVLKDESLTEAWAEMMLEMAPNLLHFYSGDLLNAVSARFLNLDAVSMTIGVNDAVEELLSGRLFEKALIGPPGVISSMQRAIAQSKDHLTVEWDSKVEQMLARMRISDASASVEAEALRDELKRKLDAEVKKTVLKFMQDRRRIKLEARKMQAVMRAVAARLDPLLDAFVASLDAGMFAEESDRRKIAAVEAKRIRGHMVMLGGGSETESERARRELEKKSKERQAAQFLEDEKATPILGTHVVVTAAMAQTLREGIENALVESLMKSRSVGVGAVRAEKITQQISSDLAPVIQESIEKYWSDLFKQEGERKARLMQEKKEPFGRSVKTVGGAETSGGFFVGTDVPIAPATLEGYKNALAEAFRKDGMDESEAVRKAEELSSRLKPLLGGVLGRLLTRDSLLPLIIGAMASDLFKLLPQRYSYARVLSLPRKTGIKILEKFYVPVLHSKRFEVVKFQQKYRVFDPGLGAFREYDDAIEVGYENGSRIMLLPDDESEFNRNLRTRLLSVRSELKQYFRDQDGFTGIDKIQYKDGIRISFAPNEGEAKGDVVFMRQSNMDEKFRIHATANTQRRAKQIGRMAISPNGIYRRMEESLRAEKEYLSRLNRLKEINTLLENTPDNEDREDLMEQREKAARDVVSEWHRFWRYDRVAAERVAQEHKESSLLGLGRGTSQNFNLDENAWAATKWSLAGLAAFVVTAMIFGSGLTAAFLQQPEWITNAAFAVGGLVLFVVVLPLSLVSGFLWGRSINGELHFAFHKLVRKMDLPFGPNGTLQGRINRFMPDGFEVGYNLPLTRTLAHTDTDARYIDFSRSFVEDIRVPKASEDFLGFLWLGFWQAVNLVLRFLTLPSAMAQERMRAEESDPYTHPIALFFKILQAYIGYYRPSAQPEAVSSEDSSASLSAAPAEFREMVEDPQKFGGIQFVLPAMMTDHQRVLPTLIKEENKVILSREGKEGEVSLVVQRRFEGGRHSLEIGGISYPLEDVSKPVNLMALDWSRNDELKKFLGISSYLVSEGTLLAGFEPTRSPNTFEAGYGTRVTAKMEGSGVWTVKIGDRDAQTYHNVNYIRFTVGGRVIIQESSQSEITGGKGFLRTTTDLPALYSPDDKARKNAIRIEQLDEFRFNALPEFIRLADQVVLDGNIKADVRRRMAGIMERAYTEEINDMDLYLMSLVYRHNDPSRPRELTATQNLLRDLREEFFFGRSRSLAKPVWDAVKRTLGITSLPRQDDVPARIALIKRFIDFMEDWARKYASFYLTTHNDRTPDQILEEIDQAFGKEKKNVQIQSDRDLETYEYERTTLTTQIADIEDLYKGGELQPEKVKLRLGEKEGPAQIGVEGRNARVGVFPMKGDPWQLGHLWLIMQMIITGKLDKVVVTVDNGAPTIKPDLLTVVVREVISKLFLKLFAPFVVVCTIPREEKEHFEEIGEYTIFRIMQLNPDNIDWYYGAGSDHRPWVKTNGQNDTTKWLATHMKNKLFGYRGQKVTVIFNQRKGEEFGRGDREDLENKTKEELGNDTGIGIMTQYQTLDVSSTRIRNDGHWWTTPAFSFLMAVAFKGWKVKETAEDVDQFMPLTSDSALAALYRTKKNENMPGMKQSIEWLAAAGDKRAIPSLLPFVGHYAYEVRQAALQALKELGATREQMADGYRAALDVPERYARSEAMVALEAMAKDGYRDDRLIKPLLALLGDSVETTRLQARDVLLELEVSNDVWIGGYIAVLESSWQGARMNAIMALSDLGDKRAVAPLEAVMRDKGGRYHLDERAMAARAVQKISSRKSSTDDFRAKSDASMPDAHKADRETPGQPSFMRWAPVFAVTAFVVSMALILAVVGSGIGPEAFYPDATGAHFNLQNVAALVIVAVTLTGSILTIIGIAIFYYLSKKSPAASADRPSARLQAQIRPMDLQAALRKALDRAADDPNHVPIRIKQVWPSTLNGYAAELQAGFEQIGPLVDVPGETGEADATVVQLQGSREEMEKNLAVINQPHQGKKIVVVHRPEQLVLLYGEDGARGMLANADAIVLLGESWVGKYEALLPGKPVVAIHHGTLTGGKPVAEATQGLMDQLDPRRLEPDSVQVVGSITAWGSIRHVGDVVNLLDAVRRKDADKKVIGFAAGGKFEDAAVRELETYSERTKVLTKEVLLAAADEFTDEIAFRDWLYKWAENGNKVVVYRDYSDDAGKAGQEKELSRDMVAWMERLCDFRTEFHHEEMASERQGDNAAEIPMVEYSGTLHRPGLALFVVSNSAAMSDVEKYEHLRMVRAPYSRRDGIDFDGAAAGILKLIDDGDRRQQMIKQNLANAERLGMREIAYAYSVVARALAGKDQQKTASNDIKISDESRAQAEVLAEDLSQRTDAEAYQEVRKHLGVPSGALYDQLRENPTLFNEAFPFMEDMDDKGRYREGGVSILGHTFSMFGCIPFGDNVKSYFRTESRPYPVKKAFEPWGEAEYAGWDMTDQGGMIAGFNGMLEGMSEHDWELFNLTVLFHDAAVLIKSPEHPEMGAIVIEKVMRKLKYGEADIQFVQWLVLHHADMGNVFFGERTPAAMLGFVNQLRPEQREKAVRFLSVMTLADGRVFEDPVADRGDKTSEAKIRFYLEKTSSQRKLEEMRSRFYEYRLKAFSSDYPGNDIVLVNDAAPTKHEAVLNLIESDIPAPEKDLFIKTIGEHIEIFDYGVHVFVNSAPRSVVKILYLLSQIDKMMLEQGTALNRASFTANQGKAPAAMAAMNRILEKYSMEDLTFGPANEKFQDILAELNVQIDAKNKTARIDNAKLSGNVDNAKDRPNGGAPAGDASPIVGDGAAGSTPSKIAAFARTGFANLASAFLGFRPVAALLLRAGQIRDGAAAMDVKRMLAGLFENVLGMKVDLQPGGFSRGSSNLAQLFGMMMMVPVQILPNGAAAPTALVHPGLLSSLQGDFASNALLQIVQGQALISSDIFTVLSLAVGAVLIVAALVNLSANPQLAVEQSRRITWDAAVSVLKKAFIGTVARISGGDALDRIAANTGSEKELAEIRKAEAARLQERTRQFDAMLQSLAAAVVADPRLPRKVILSLDDDIFKGRQAADLRMKILKAVSDINAVLNDESDVKFVFIYSGKQLPDLRQAAVDMFRIPANRIEFTSQDPAQARAKVEKDFKNYALTLIITPGQAEFWKSFWDMVVEDFKTVSQILTLGERMTLQGSVAENLFNSLKDNLQNHVSYVDGVLVIDGIPAGQASSEEQLRAAELLALQA